jgi:hypothetical protein
MVDTSSTWHVLYARKNAQNKRRALWVRATVTKDVSNIPAVEASTHVASVIIARQQPQKQFRLAPTCLLSSFPTSPEHCSHRVASFRYHCLYQHNLLIAGLPSPLRHFLTGFTSVELMTAHHQSMSIAMDAFGVPHYVHQLVNPVHSDDVIHLNLTRHHNDTAGGTVFPNNTINSTSINGSTSFDPVLSSCYDMPYGAAGMMVHIILTWNMVMLCCDRRPLIPILRNSNTTISTVLCLISLLAVSFITVISNYHTECDDSIV